MYVRSYSVQEFKDFAERLDSTCNVNVLVDEQGAFTLAAASGERARAQPLSSEDVVKRWNKQVLAGLIRASLCPEYGSTISNY